MNFKLLLILFIINNLLHYINEKVIIVIFFVVFFYLLKILSELLETEYNNKISSIENDISDYMETNFNILRYKKKVFKDIFEFCYNFLYQFKKIQIKFKKTIKNLFIKKEILNFNKKNNLNLYLYLK